MDPHLEKLSAAIDKGQNSPVYAEAYGEMRIGCLAISDDIYDGYRIAWQSGLAHRMSKQNVAWQLVHSPSIAVVGMGMPHCEEQPVQVSVDYAKRELREWYLGCSPRPLFDSYPRITWPETALFVYPENYLVPKEEHQFVDRVVKGKIAKTVYIITKSGVILSDMLSDLVLVIQRAPKED